MGSTVARVLFAVVLSGAVVRGFQEWLDRPFDTWTSRETRTVLGDSAWAGSVAVRVEMPTLGRPMRWTLKAHAVWSSALPVRQAEWRRQNPQAQGVSDADRPALAEGPSGYLITVRLDGDSIVSMLVSDGKRGILSAVLRQGDIVIPAARTRSGWLNETGEIEWGRDSPLPCQRGDWPPAGSPFWSGGDLHPGSHAVNVPGSEFPSFPDARHRAPESSCQFKGAVEFEFPRSTSLRPDGGNIYFESISTRTMPARGGSQQQRVVLTKSFDPQRMIAGGDLAL